MSIPKKLHYCWFGGGSKNEKIGACMDSWRKNLPEFEIVEWNESNCDVYASEYSSSAYKAEKWAFVSDYFRLKVLFENGGVYLDTDMLLHKPLDEFLVYDAFFPMEDYLNVCGGIVGAVPNSIIIGKMLERYGSMKWNPSSSTVCKAITKVLVDECGLEYNGQTQTLKGNVAVFSPNVLIVDVHDGRNVCEHLYDPQPSWWDWQSSTGETYKYTVLQRYFYNLQGRSAKGKTGDSLIADTKEMLARYGAKKVVLQIFKDRFYGRMPHQVVTAYRKWLKGR
jgi:mannosyltransferase OCH1-like enzyme